MLRHFYLLPISIALFAACAEKKPTTLFEEQPAEKTGIAFQNTVVQQGENNVLNYPYYFNGGGVALGDINNDGLIDIYFSGNQVPNKLYLNKGDFSFEDITDKAGVALAQGWKTGVTMADVNQDGWLDIYVCRSAMSDSAMRKNQLFINQGNLTFKEMADAYGIGDDAYATQAAFFDYDKDGDQDLFLLNHSLPNYAGFGKVMPNLKAQKNNAFGSKLYRNDHLKFTDVSQSAGLVNNVLSFGLGVAISDLNNDGWPDVYVSNDFNEEDYLYINNHDGTFKNAIKDATGHVSLYSMGSDIADINNDAQPDILTLDMLPETNERIKLSSGDDNYDKYNLLVKSGFHRQAMRNMLQLNNGDGTFSEIGQLAGIANTDWSWAALVTDFDGDGWKDVFISNGYEKDYTNMQFLKFAVDGELKARQTGVKLSMDEILNNMPSIEVGNFFFRNNGNLTFSKRSSAWGITRSFKSNGAAYADLDNDGDPDLVINTMNQPAVLYKNSGAKSDSVRFLKIDVRKQNLKRVVDGTKIYASASGRSQYVEVSPVRGFQSCMVAPVMLGAKGIAKFDSVRIVWPDNKTQVLTNVDPAKILEPRYEDATATYVYPQPPPALFEKTTLAEWKHEPLEINDFKRQLLLPKLYSYSGPRIATGDVNHDGLQDFYTCGPRKQSGALFIQSPDGSFKQQPEPAFQKDKDFQDEDAAFFDADGDGDVDLYVVSGGYMSEEKDPLLQDRLYLNNGKGHFVKAADAIPAEAWAGACVVPFDVDGDKDDDLFVGSRLTPGQYPITPSSMLLINDGKGHFADAIKDKASALQEAGMITSATAADVNKDGKTDLIVVGEWMPVKIFINNNGKLDDASTTWLSQPEQGWWNAVLADDFDGDGDLDAVVGNYGLNQQYNVSPEHPATLVYKNFNNDSQIDFFFCYYRDGVSYPYASRDEALGQVAFLKPRYPDYTSYANTTLKALFKPDELKDTITLHANNLASLYLENKDGHFEAHVLPIEAQFSTIHAIAAADVDGDGDKDLVVGGNDSYNRVRIGECDALTGLVLLNDGKGNFTPLSKPRSGLDIKGDTRGLVFIPTAKGLRLVAGVTGQLVQEYSVR